MLLTAYNYKLMLYGVLCVLIGFGGMYIEGQQFGVFSLYIAPLLVLGGFILVAIAVFRPDPAHDAADEKPQESTRKSSSSE